MTTFASIRSQNVTFQNFAVDFQVPTIIDVTVESVEGNTATVYVPEVYNYSVNNGNVIWTSDTSPYTKAPYWTMTNLPSYTQRFDTVTGLTKRGNTQYNPLFRGSRVTDAGNHRLKFTWNSKPAEVRPGMSYQMRDTMRDHPGAFLWESKDLVLKNLDIHYLHGFGMVGQHTENITMTDVDFEAPYASGRTTAGFADFIQMSGTKGNIDISECTFSNPHDDPINVHGTFLRVEQKIEPNKVRVRYQHHETSGFPSFYPDDMVEFTSQNTLTPVANFQAKVVAVDGPDGKGGNQGKGSGNLRDIIVTLDRDIPAEVQRHQYVLENISYTPNVHIHNNIFKETPTRGILVTTRGKVVIENNLFDGMGMAGIFISNDAKNGRGWFESGRTVDVTIRNNVFQRGAAQAIFVEPTNDSAHPDRPVHVNHEISGNTFYTSDQRIYDAKSVENVNFTGNTLLRGDAQAQVTLSEASSPLTVGQTAQLEARASSSEEGQRLFRLDSSKNIRVHGNTYDEGLN